MRPEYPTIHVHLVDYDEAKRFEETSPVFVGGQDADMQHIGVCQDQMTEVAKRTPVAFGSIASIGSRSDMRPGDQLQQLAKLVLGQGFGRKQIQSTNRGFGKTPLESWKIVAKRLATIRSSHNDKIPAFHSRVIC